MELPPVKVQLNRYEDGGMTDLGELAVAAHVTLKELVDAILKKTKLPLSPETTVVTTTSDEGKTMRLRPDEPVRLQQGQKLVIFSSQQWETLSRKQQRTTSSKDRSTGGTSRGNSSGDVVPPVKQGKRIEPVSPNSQMWRSDSDIQHLLRVERLRKVGGGNLVRRSYLNLKELMREGMDASMSGPATRDSQVNWQRETLRLRMLVAEKSTDVLETAELPFVRHPVSGVWIWTVCNSCKSSLVRLLPCSSEMTVRPGPLLKQWFGEGSLCPFCNASMQSKEREVRFLLNDCTLSYTTTKVSGDPNVVTIGSRGKVGCLTGKSSGGGLVVAAHDVCFTLGLPQNSIRPADFYEPWTFAFRGRDTIKLEMGRKWTSVFSDGKAPTFKPLPKYVPDAMRKSIDTWTPLHAWAWGGGEVTRAALEPMRSMCARRTAEGLLPLHVFVARNHKMSEAYIFLRDSTGAEEVIKPTLRGTAIHIAASVGNVELMQDLFAKFPQLASDSREGCGATPLFLAAANGHTQCVAELLQRGADPSSAIENGATPLHVAAMYGRTECVTLLLKRGAQVNARTLQGFSPLHFAASEGHMEALVALMDGGASLDAKAHNGETPVHSAARTGRAPCLRELLARGASPSAAASEQVAPLHLAAFHGHTKAVRQLKSANANASAVTVDRHTAFHMANMAGNVAVLKELL